MGILTLLRNAFGRSRKPRATEPEGALETPEQLPVPEPRQSPTEEHDLVAAAFDNVKVPHQTPPETEPDPVSAQPKAEAEPVAAEPKAEAEPVAAEPKAETQPNPTTEAEAAEPKAEAETAPKPEAEAETEPEEPEAAAEPKPAEPEAASKPEPAPEKAPETAAPTEPVPEAVAETVRQPEAATETAAAPEPEPEPKAAAEPEPTAEAAAEPEPEPAAAPEPEPKAAAEPEPEPEAETAEPKQEAAATAEPEPEPPAETDPQAADGEDAPQGPPAPDNETRTGGAGGNTDAEGEAEAPAHTDPQAADGEDTPQGPPAPDDEARTGGAGGNTDAEGEAEAAAKPKPATPLTKVKSRTPALTTAYKAATTTLRKKNLTGTRAKLYLVLDRSASMRPYYKDGSAQSLADQTLALAAHLDPGPDPAVHVVFFSTEVDGTTDLTLTPGHETTIDDAHAGLGRMGRTSYHAAVAAVLDHYDRHVGKDADKDPVPALVVFQTDGAPDAKTPATQALTEAARTHPGVFFSFVAFGDHDNKAFDYLRRLKTPNASFFHAGPTPRELTDAELYEGVLADWRP
ncbi:VWA domain-containing protein [Streptomyces achromogenes]|uniref:VWA domain-containing protein n=1 Tax=Streptomyces achromogenes TaxID=67255 RepID=UPI0036C53C2B